MRGWARAWRAVRVSVRSVGESHSRVKMWDSRLAGSETATTWWRSTGRVLSSGVVSRPAGLPRRMVGRLGSSLRDVAMGMTAESLCFCFFCLPSGSGSRWRRVGRSGSLSGTEPVSVEGVVVVLPVPSRRPRCGRSGSSEAVVEEPVEDLVAGAGVSSGWLGCLPTKCGRSSSALRPPSMTEGCADALRGLGLDGGGSGAYLP